MTCFVHHVPGRLRVKVEKLKHQISKANTIRHLFCCTHGIYKVSVNTLTGSIVINYDPAVFSMDQLMDILKYNHVIDPEQKIIFEKPISERSTQMGMAVGRAVFSWVVGKALERSGLGFLAVFI